jgi:hypothetical protein
MSGCDWSCRPGPPLCSLAAPALAWHSALGSSPGDVLAPFSQRPSSGRQSATWRSPSPPRSAPRCRVGCGARASGREHAHRPCGRCRRRKPAARSDSLIQISDRPPTPIRRQGSSRATRARRSAQPEKAQDDDDDDDGPHQPNDAVHVDLPISVRGRPAAAPRPVGRTADPAQTWTRPAMIQISSRQFLSTFGRSRGFCTNTGRGSSGCRS